MEEPTTCGGGIAARSELPAKLAETLADLAAVLEVHMRALDLRDPEAKQEYEAYQTLAGEHRKLAAQLQATSDRMAGYRVLPMGRHDPDVASDTVAIEAFAKFVRAKQELQGLLRETIARDQQMLSEQRGVDR